MPGARVQIRPATFADLGDIARIHVLSWQQGYKGQIAREYLDHLDVGVRRKKWEDIFRSTATEHRFLYLALEENVPVGFISFGPGRDKRFAGQMEIYATYLVQEAWGMGIGHALFKTMTETAIAKGLSKAYVWVLDTNERAINAYRRWGGVLNQDITLADVIGTQSVTEVAVIFDFITVG